MPIMRILHVAETAKDGMATMMRDLLRDQVTRSGSGKVACLVRLDRWCEMGLLDALGVCSLRRHACRGLLGVLVFAWAVLKAVASSEASVVRLHSSFAGVVGRAILVPLLFTRRC